MVPGEEDVTAATYAAARLLSGAATGARLQVRGRTTQSDGGQGLFTWVAGGSTTIDDGFELAAPGGIWRRADTSFVTYEMFGAVPMTSLADVSHDSTTAINNCHLAIPPKSGATRRPFKILLLGLYGISATINFRDLMGIEFVGTAQFANLGTGYVWIAALSNTTHTLFWKGCRYCQMRRIRVQCNSETVTGANAQLSAFCLADDYVATIQQQCVFKDITIGNRDSYDSLGALGTYQFINGFVTETITGTFGNNDVHLFESVRIQQVVNGWNNQGSQSGGWVYRNCKVVQSDTFLKQKASSAILYNMEADGMNQAVFLLGTGGTDTNNIHVIGYIAQTNFAELAIIQGLANFTVEDSQFDQNCKPGQIGVVNPTHPYFIVANGGGVSSITLKHFQFFAIPPVIDFGTTAALKHLNLKGGHPASIAINNPGSMAQDQRIVFHWEPGDINTSWALGSTDWSPKEQLLYPPYSLVPDPLLTEFPFPTVRCGRRNTSACTDIKTATASGTPGAGATFTFTNALPIGLILGVSLHNAFNPGPTSMNIGDGVTAARWGNKTNTSDSLDNPPRGSLIAGYTDASPFYNKALANIVITAVGGNFSGGGNPLVVTVHYIDFASRYYNPNASG